MASVFMRDAKVQWLLIFFPALIAFAISLLFLLTNFADATRPHFWTGVAMMILGYAMLVRSKWDQVRRGDLFSWGLSPESQKFLWLYRMSYVFMGVGFLLAGFSGAL